MAPPLQSPTHHCFTNEVSVMRELNKSTESAFALRRDRELRCTTAIDAVIETPFLSELYSWAIFLDTTDKWTLEPL